MPESIGTLSKLEYLSVESNRLPELPQSLVRLLAQCSVRLSYNPLPAAVVDQLDMALLALLAHRALHPEQGPQVKHPWTADNQLKANVCTSINEAVKKLAKKSCLHYTIDPVVLDRVVRQYLLDAKPGFNDLKNVQAKVEGDQWHVQCASLLYGLAGNNMRQGKFVYCAPMNLHVLVDGRVDTANGDILEGKWQYIKQFKVVGFSEGTSTFPNGEKHIGTFKYVSEKLPGTWLVKGTIEYADGRAEEGEFAYIEPLTQMKLVNGTTRNAQGDVVKEGRREYVVEKKGMCLMRSVSVFADCVRQEGTRSYIPELNQVVMTAGTMINGISEKTGIWVFSEVEGRMVFKPKPPKPKVPQFTTR